LSIVGGLIFFFFIRKRQPATKEGDVEANGNNDGSGGTGGAEGQNPVVDANNNPIPLQPAGYVNPEMDSNSSRSVGRVQDKIELGDDHEEEGSHS
jgi:hypothetical protein